MGSVYEARHEVLGHKVALKFLHPEIARQPNLQQRFLQEARLSATIDNPHIVRVTDVDTSDEGAYLVMELLQGEPLQSLLEREHRLDPGTAIGFTLQLLQGLAAAHERGVVHRDLKPDNVFVTPGIYGPLLKILDFGIAKLRATEEYQMTLTRPGAVMGTPEYMAPEQAFSADLVDARSDLYSIGIILFEMLSGSLPAEGDSPQKIAERALKGQVLRLADLCPDLPRALIDVVNRAIDPVPERRWPSAADLQRALLAASPTQSSQLPQDPSRASALPNFEYARSSGLPHDSELAAFQSQHATPVVPREQLAERLSNVPVTVAQELGPPPVTGEPAVRIKTQSMPEVSAPDEQTRLTRPATPRRRQRSALPWVLVSFFSLLVTAGALGWYYQDHLLDLPTPPQPTRHAGALGSPPASAAGGVEESDPGPGELEELQPLEPDPIVGAAPRPPPYNPTPGTPTPPPAKESPGLPTFTLPTHIQLPPSFPTSFPTSLPTVITLPTELPPGFPFPLPGGTPPKQAAPDETAPAP
jgi:serine/threonine-protein kinase